MRVIRSLLLDRPTVPATPCQSLSNFGSAGWQHTSLAARPDGVGQVQEPPRRVAHFRVSRLPAAASASGPGRSLPWRRGCAHTALRAGPSRLPAGTGRGLTISAAPNGIDRSRQSPSGSGWGTIDSRALSNVGTPLGSAGGLDVCFCGVAMDGGHLMAHQRSAVVGKSRVIAGSGGFFFIRRSRCRCQ